MLKEYKNPAHNCGLQGGERSVHHVGRGSDGKAVMDPAKPKSAEVSTMTTTRTN